MNRIDSLNAPSTAVSMDVVDADADDYDGDGDGDVDVDVDVADVAVNVDVPSKIGDDPIPPAAFTRPSTKHYTYVTYTLFSLFL